MAISAYTKTGSKATASPKLDKNIFELKVENTDLISQVYQSEKANQRISTAKTKTRTEVSGGGKKPWKQKGTGRARAGSIRSPIWRGGGITFGPTGEQNWTSKVNRASSKVAVKQALSLANKDGRVSIIEALPNTGKTSDMAKIISKLENNRNLLVINTGDAKEELAIRNIANVKLTSASKVSTHQILDAYSVLITKDAVKELEARLGDKNE